MKKGISILLCTFYLLSVSGVRVGIHYCHGHFQIITVNANLNEDACCGKKQPMKKHGCCSDKVIEIKVKSEQKISTVTGLQSPQKYNLIATINSGLNATPLVTSDISTCPQGHSPPWRMAIPLFIEHRNFRI